MAGIFGITFDLVKTGFAVGGGVVGYGIHKFGYSAEMTKVKADVASVKSALDAAATKTEAEVKTAVSKASAVLAKYI